MELQFAAVSQHLRRASQLAEQIGHRRAAMLTYDGLAHLYYETGEPGLALENCSAGLAIARSLGARRFIAYYLMLQAQSEFEAGEPQAEKTIHEANEMARETPSFVLPWGLGLAAMIARNAEERASALDEGERVLAGGVVGHNIIFFNRWAIEACIAAKDWAGVQRYATALEQGLAEEPLPMSNFLVARARAIAAAGRGRKDETELRRLLGEANRIGWRVVVPSLETALAAS